jgi:hypothetical protein
MNDDITYADKRRIIFYAQNQFEWALRIVMESVLIFITLLFVMSCLLVLMCVYGGTVAGFPFYGAWIASSTGALGVIFTCVFDAKFLTLFICGTFEGEDTAIEQKHYRHMLRCLDWFTRFSVIFALICLSACIDKVISHV